MLNTPQYEAVRPEASLARTSPPGNDVGATARLHCSLPGRARPGLASLRPHTQSGFILGRTTIVCEMPQRKHTIRQGIVTISGRNNNSFVPRNIECTEHLSLGLLTWDLHRRPYVGVSRPRSWSHLLVLGAISWAFIAKY